MTSNGTEFEISNPVAPDRMPDGQHLFDRYYRHENVQGHPGMGIGLSLCRSIVESHRGRLTAENLYNEGAVTGCKFTFWLPLG